MCDTPSFLAKRSTDRFTLSVVYAPDKVDTQGHQASAETIEKAAWSFLANKGENGVMHLDGMSGERFGSVVESYIYRGPDWVMKDVNGGEVTIRSGTWLMGNRWSEPVWTQIENRTFNGMSLQGKAKIARRPKA